MDHGLFTAPNIIYEKPHADGEDHDVKFRIVKYESWGDFIWAALAWLLPPLRLLPSVAPLYKTHPEILKKSKYNASVWQERASQAVLVLLVSLKMPLALAGHMLEWYLNFYHANNGFIGLFSKLLVFDIKGIIFNPKGKDRSTYYSVVGWLDQRTDLIYPYSSKLKIDPSTGEFHYNSKIFADLCMMASKLAYESPYVQKPIVNKQWNMCFQQFYECENAHIKLLGILQSLIHKTIVFSEKHLGLNDIPVLAPLLKILDEFLVLCPNTQAFTFTDKSRDADLVVLAFRGTEPFSADDWATDFDFSFVELDNVIGRLHVGFLEALGLIDRDAIKGSGKSLKENLYDPKKDITTGLSLEKLQHMARKDTIRIKEFHKHYGDVETEMRELAYKVSVFERICTDLLQLLIENPKAQLVVTGHSLGGALAAMFAGLLLHKNVERNEKKLLIESLAAVYTFGQPRIGDRVFARSMARKLEKHKVRYYRFVYAYDLVPRVPYDDMIFGFKHFGFCCYNSILFQQKALIEQPNKNFVGVMFSMVMRISAGWELVNGMLVNRVLYGDDFCDSGLMALARFVALMMPGMVAHAPTNYVNSVRLGPPHLRNVPFDETL